MRKTAANAIRLTVFMLENIPLTFSSNNSQIRIKLNYTAMKNNLPLEFQFEILFDIRDIFSIIFVFFMTEASVVNCVTPILLRILSLKL